VATDFTMMATCFAARWPRVLFRGKVATRFATMATPFAGRWPQACRGAGHEREAARNLVFRTNDSDRGGTSCRVGTTRDGETLTIGVEAFVDHLARRASLITVF
jgi:hypothetical protein